jgi:hypothetical protein
MAVSWGAQAGTQSESDAGALLRIGENTGTAGPAYARRVPVRRELTSELLSAVAFLVLGLLALAANGLMDLHVAVAMGFVIVGAEAITWGRGARNAPEPGDAIPALPDDADRRLVDWRSVAMALPVVAALVALVAWLGMGDLPALVCLGTAIGCVGRAAHVVEWEREAHGELWIARDGWRRPGTRYVLRTT